MATKQLQLSIIIPTLNEETHIQNILYDIINSSSLTHSYEIIVSDSGSRDQTKAMVRSIQKQYPNISLKFFTAVKKGVSIARNTGAAQAKGTYLMFLDADSRIAQDFLTKNLKEMLHRKLDIGGCYAIPDCHNWLDNFLFSVVNNFCLRGLQYTPKPMALGAAILTKASMHHRIGGFDKDIPFGEDVEYVTEAKKIGRFRMLNSRPVIFSMRRGEKEGRFQLVGKAVTGFVYHLFHRSMKNIHVVYKFGNYNK